MQFTHPELDATFEIPEPVSVRTMLQYESFIEASFAPIYERLWPAVVSLAENWQCPLVELRADALDTLELPQDAEAYEVIKWACLATFSLMNDAKEVPKN